MQLHVAVYGTTQDVESFEAREAMREGGVLRPDVWHGERRSAPKTLPTMLTGSLEHMNDSTAEFRTEEKRTHGILVYYTAHVPTMNNSETIGRWRYAFWLTRKYSPDLMYELVCLTDYPMTVDGANMLTVASSRRNMRVLSIDARVKCDIDDPRRGEVEPYKGGNNSWIR